MKVVVTDKDVLNNPIMDFTPDKEYEVVKTWNAGTEHREQMYVVENNSGTQYKLSEDEVREVREVYEFKPGGKLKILKHPDAKPTVGDLIDSLKQFDPKLPVEIAINQYNKVYPVAYVHPRDNGYGSLASGRNPDVVRIDVRLPEDEKSYMATRTRKK